MATNIQDQIKSLQQLIVDLDSKIKKLNEDIPNYMSSIASYDDAISHEPNDSKRHNLEYTRRQLNNTVISLIDQRTSYTNQLNKTKSDLAEALITADKLSIISLTPQEKALLETTKAQNQSMLIKASSYAQNHKVIVVSILLIVLILVAIIVVKKFIL